jgi:mRNA interferase MazF
MGKGEGLPSECVASFDNLQRVSRSALTRRAGELAEHNEEICRALRALADCR